MKRDLLKGFFGLVFFMAWNGSQADLIHWTQWTSATPGTPGIATGTIQFPDQDVTVTYLGELFNAPDPGNWNQYPSTYTLPGVVDNQPSPANMSIQLTGGNNVVNTLEFSTPLIDPVMAIQSLGSGYEVVAYIFAQPFVLLAQGRGRWGGGSNSLSQNGNSLLGSEGNGIIQFQGTYSSISWIAPSSEFYQLFTIGAPYAVPTPPALWLLGLAVAGFIGRARLTKR